MWRGYNQAKLKMMIFMNEVSCGHPWWCESSTLER